MSEYLLACKEQKAREIGIHLYARLFEEFNDPYSRHEVSNLVSYISSLIIKAQADASGLWFMQVLGALITHV